ncbi:hypothetical protein BH10PLA2_BH10PLA2_37800 [soil metagenome]
MNAITLTALLAVTFGMPEAPVQTRAQSALQKLVASKCWIEQAAALDALRSLGNPGLKLIQRTAVRNADLSVRRLCYESLMRDFACDKNVIKMLISEGLADSDEEIRYRCAFFMGEHKIYSAHRRLRLLFKFSDLSERTRLAAQKSLAELGDSDVFPHLCKALGSDSYQDRILGNVGIKALSGRNLNEFGNYDFAEGAYFLGVQLSVGIDGIRDAERKAKRFQALTAYCRWLKEARPDLYKHLTADY